MTSSRAFLHRSSMVVACCVTWIVCGCGKRDADPALSGPATQSTANNVSHGISLKIDDVEVLFPNVEFHAYDTGNGVAVDLSAPLANAGPGNTLNLGMTLEDVDVPANLAGAAWSFSTDDEERADTLNEITLNGRTVVLEPSELHVSFTAGADETLTIQIEGQFRWFDPPDAEKSQKTVAVRGTFIVPMPKAE